MRRSGLVFRFVVLLTLCLFTGGTLIGDVSYAQDRPLVLRGGPGRLVPSASLMSNYTEVVFATRGGAEVLVQNRRGVLLMPGFTAGRFELEHAEWADPALRGRDGFFVGPDGVAAKRLLDGSGRVAGAFLLSDDRTEMLFDLDHNNRVELSVLNSADGFVRITMAGEAGREAFELLLNGQNPFCQGGPRGSTMAERARGDAAGCAPGRGSGSSGAGGPHDRPRDPMDVICAGYDPVRGRFSGGVHAGDGWLPVTETLLEFGRDGFDGERDQAAAAGRFIVLSPLIGLVAVIEFGIHEVTSGGQLGVIIQNSHERHDEPEETGEGEGDPAEGATPPDTSGGDTSRPADGGGFEGPLGAMCGSRGQPSQSEAMRTTFMEAMSTCPNPVESTAAAGEATASCMNGVISRPRGSRGFLAITEQMLREATAGCSGEERCAGDRTGRLRQLLGITGAHLGGGEVCDPAVCQPTPD